MPYYTTYKLTVKDGGTDYEQLVIKELGHNPFVSPCKWYNFAGEMKKLSKKHPKVLFEITGEGEEALDLWRAYFKGGKMQICEAIVTYDSFDEAQMK